jgi:hypothetical protein
MIFILSLFISTFAFAGTEFSGIWSGDGTATDQMGLVYPGCHIEIEMDQIDTQFSIRQGSYQCNNLTGNINAFSVEIMGNELFYGNEKVGTIEPGHVGLKHTTQDFHTYYDLTIDHGAIVFQDTQFNAIRSEIYINIAGLLIHR